MKKLYIFLILISSLFATTYHNGYVNFKEIIKKNIAGNIETVGNTVECVTNLKFSKKGDIKNAKCQNDYTTYYNNKYLTKYINILDNNTSIFNSSKATLNFPSSYKKIVWAALFWQGHINNYSYQYSYTDKKDSKGYDKYYDNQSYNHKTIYRYIKYNGKYYYHLSNDLPKNNAYYIRKTNANQLILYLNNHYYKLTANELDYKSDSRRFKDNKTHRYITKYGAKYSAYAILPQSIIDKLNSLSNTNKEVNVTVANIATTFGLDEKLGNYGAWSLVVIYSETPKINNFRSNIVYYGFRNIYKGAGNNEVNIPISGLVLPKNGNVNSLLSVFSAEGEYINKGNSVNPESVRINGEYLDENLSGYDKYNVFDSRLSDDIQRYPKLNDNNGIDIDVFDVSKQLTTIRDNEKALNPQRVSYNLNIKATTYNDGVFLSTIAFSTQLYVPKVCYYDLNLYDEYGNLITSNSKIYVGEKLQVRYKVKNDEKESANKVYVIYPFDDNSTKYISNSTDVKNVLENNFTHYNDNETKGNLGVEVNDSGLKIGILGDKFNEFKPYYIDNKYVAGIEFNITLEKEGNLSFDFYTNYNYFIGNQNYTYDGILPNCNEFNQTYSVFTPKLGIFNVLHYQPNLKDDPTDVNDSINALYTQIVNKDFPISVVKLKDDNHTVENYTGYIKLDLINAPQSDNECKTSTSIIPSKYVKFYNQSQRDINIVVPDSYKDLRFRVVYIQSTDACFNDISSIINNFNPSTVGDKFKNCGSCSDICQQSLGQCKSLDNCENGVSKCLNCVFNSANTKTVCSRDNFAVRPNNFIIETNSSKVKAGDEFNLTIKALDYNGNIVSNYEENLTINGGNSPTLEDLDLNTSKGAITQKLNSITRNPRFYNGIATITLTYPEVGDLDINISEINGSEFAKVDEKDTPQNNRLIKKADINLTFIPYKFNISAIYKNYKDFNFTYISNDLNMSSLLEINITSVNKAGNITKNYSKNLYANDVNLTIVHTNIDNKILSNKNLDEENSSQFSLLINKNYFIQGKNQEDILLNINRKYDEVIEPINFTIDKIKVEDKEDNLTTENDLNESNLFIYGRIDIPNISGYGNELNTTYQYEYWTKNGWILNKEHNSSLLGDVNLSKSIYNFVNLNVFNIYNGEENVTFYTTHALPYSTKIHLSIPSWLWYNPLATTYKDPSVNNKDCLTHPCESITFNKDNSGWGGIGKNNVKSSESNRTVEFNSSTTSVNSNKREVRKLNW